MTHNAECAVATTHAVLSRLNCGIFWKNEENSSKPYSRLYSLNPCLTGAEFLQIAFPNRFGELRRF